MSNSDTLIDLIEGAFARYPDNPAFTCLGKTLSYRDLEQLSRAFATYLQRYTGLKPGDRIALQLPNLLQYPVVVYGALRAGLVIVNTNPLYTSRELRHQFIDSGAKALVVLSLLEETALEVVPETAITTIIRTAPTDLHTPISPTPAPANAKDTGSGSGSPNIIEFREALALGMSSSFSRVTDITPQHLALLQYTGGTTGAAKGAMLSHQNLLANVGQVIRHSGRYFSEGREIYVNALPLYHIYAFNIHLLALLSRGGHNLLIPNPRDTDALVEAIRPHRFTGFPGINTLFASLCRSESFKQLDFSALNSTSSGGMALNEQTATHWRQLTGVDISEGYGMTEASPTISANPPGNIRPGTVGVPLPGTEVKVIDAQGNTLAAGEAGELCVRGPQVMQGYWQQPQATREILSEDGWLRTGDIAVVEADGYLRIVDRLKDMIVVSGFNVYPIEIEEVASAYPGVTECAAISVPDERSGEAIKLFVVADNPDFDTDALREFLRTRLTAYKIPKHIVQIDQLPKSNVGKILRRELRN